MRVRKGRRKVKIDGGSADNYKPGSQQSFDLFRIPGSSDFDDGDEAFGRCPTVTL
jgi:hypothetical protein